MRGIAIVQRRDPTGIIGPIIRPVHNLRTGFLVESNTGLYVPLPKLIENQFDDELFDRCDLLLLAAAMEGDQRAKEVYDELASKLDHLETRQEIRARFSEQERVRPAGIGYNGKLIGIAECTRQFTRGQRFIHCQVTRSRTPPPVSNIDLERNLTEASTAISRQIVMEQLREIGYLFQVVIWPPALQFEEEITSIIESRGRIRDRMELDLDGSLREFMNDLYETQDSVVWEGIWDKYDVLSQYDPSVVVLFVEFPDARVREGTSHQMRYIKETARRRLYGELDHGEISYTCILHASDNFEHNLTTWDVIQTYR